MEIVNGYVCKNCTDVAYAKKGIDPAHPKDGPNGVDAKDKPGKPGKPDAKGDHGPAVTFGGALAQAFNGVQAQTGAPAATGAQTPNAVSPTAAAPSALAPPGSTLNISA
jgi:hypothetical protein